MNFETGEEDGSGWGGLAPERKPKRCAVPSGRITQFDYWWDKDGKFYDPDSEDVSWYDKRKELAEYAFNAAMKLTGGAR